MNIKTKIAAVLTALTVGLVPAAAGAAPLIESHKEVPYGTGTQYQVTPTDYARNLGSSARNVDPSPDLTAHGIPANPSIVGQFICHAVFAASKPTWNLESHRPAVSEIQYISSQCNP